MSWNPESGDALTSPAINIMDVEASSMKLWHEFLDGWFDGSQHMLRGAFVDIPQADAITFQEQPLSPGDGFYIHVTTDQQSSTEIKLHGDDRWMVHEYVKLNFWLRSLVKTKRNGHNSLSLVRWGADTLYAILSSKILVAPLQRKGMGRLRPMPPKLVSGGTVAMRHLPLTVCYTYPLEETTLMTAPQMESSVPGAIVYIGRDRSVRITPLGFERKKADGTWVAIDVVTKDGENIIALTPTET